MLVGRVKGVPGGAQKKKDKRTKRKSGGPDSTFQGIRQGSQKILGERYL